MEGRQEIMSKICPLTNEKVLYLDCLDCETKECRSNCRCIIQDKQTGKGMSFATRNILQDSVIQTKQHVIICDPKGEIS